MCEVANYTEVEYNRHLTDAGWSRPETDHLMDLAQRFDLRFIVMADRWDANTYKEMSVEDLKERLIYKLASPSPQSNLQTLLEYMMTNL